MSAVDTHVATKVPCAVVAAEAAPITTIKMFAVCAVVPAAYAAIITMTIVYGIHAVGADALPGYGALLVKLIFSLMIQALYQSRTAYWQTGRKGAIMRHIIETITFPIPRIPGPDLT